MVFSALVLISFNMFFTVNSKAGSGADVYQYTPWDPIDIVSDGDLLSFEGSGTFEDPYLIEGFNITTTDSYGIYVTNITKHLLIRNCFIAASFNSIFVENIFEGEVRIENNICANSKRENGKGIVVFTTYTVAIQNNLCYDNEAFGIVVTFCHNTLIRQNYCFRNGDTGISVALVDNLAIYGNSCYENSKTGLFVGGTDSAVLYNNTCFKNGEEGVIIEECEGIILLNNTISENGNRGVFLLNSDYCFFNYNLFENNNYYGLTLDENSDNNQIYNNYFVGNYKPEKAQAEDNGKGNSWSNYINELGNFWDNLNGDAVYKISGRAESVDLFPIKKETDLETNAVNIHYTTIIFSFFILLFFYLLINEEKKYLF